ncbi:phytanoyl-CoA dioxygenase family protein [Pseudaquabacterium pictum]|uniref:Phytanoyl-CoA dioxygenase n=1 Tax=Pseudaquabacterium pictum TaxID=2315236 RepID=A0A480ALZ3_9BURK|nr:phytanoyl-CoA dioxygenase family protein [Rubrivivax pictus]GCL61760.1 phytanoyl-CoA dioxygenase [Rubrivivax pictus]
MTNDVAQRAAAAATPDLVAAYQRDGAVCLRGLLNADELAQLRRGIDANLAAPSPRAIVASQPDDPGFFIEDFCNWPTNADYRALALESPLAQVAARLMQSSTVRLYHDHMLTKEPGTRQKTPWHQDQPYYNVDGAQNVSFWVPADPVARPSTLEFVAGSHRGPWLMPRTFMTNQARWFPEGSLADLPDIEADRAAFHILRWALEPGDVVAFHMLALHAAGGVAPGQRRRVFSLRYLGDDARHAPRRWTTSPEFPGLADRLPSGAPMDDALFPLLVGGSA